MDKKKLTSKEKKLKRKEELLRKRAVDEIIKLAYEKTDHLIDFPAFIHFNRNGISVSLHSTNGASLSVHMKHFIQDLLKVNMEGPYGTEWAEEEKVKRREMVAPDARYITVSLNETVNDVDKASESSLGASEESHPHLWKGSGGRVVGFVQYRFVVEEEVPVLYVYELQLEKDVQGRGLGKFLMQLLELIARKNHMKAVMLTVQKRNVGAMRFYQEKLRYQISSLSPSRVDPVVWADSTYDILCKPFEMHASDIL